LRYSRKIWVDVNHYLPLKTEVIGADSGALEQVLFTDLAVINSAEPTQTETSATLVHTKHIHASPSQPFENAFFMLKNWPEGFKTIYYMPNSLEQSGKVVDHLFISDGFSSVSVYIEPKDEPSVEGLNTLGSVNSYSRLIGKYQLTVLGEVPAATVEFIAQGVALR
jgi:sigma-E factor negative regulatory protein RseB